MFWKIEVIILEIPTTSGKIVDESANGSLIIHFDVYFLSMGMLQTFAVYCAKRLKQVNLTYFIGKFNHNALALE